jgi:hypothetical protein
MTVTEQGAANHVMGDPAQPLTGRDQGSCIKLLDGHEPVIREHLMVTGELDADLTGSRTLRRAIGKAKDTPPGERRGVPTDDPSANKASIGID